ncbi:MAG TPA: PHB depolymerase family esterase, partial [Planctomycetota bacterium]|nr:PHB depolymerase family esterase [Planctomycetota bacterium]
GYAVCHVNGGFHSQYWDGTVRQLRLRAPDARVATIAIEPVASPHSAEVSGAPEADFVVFAERRADDPQDGEGTVWVQQGLKYRLHLPAAATDGARVPLLIWLPDDGTTAEENLSLWRMRLGDEAAVAVLEAPNVETQEDLAPGGRWFGAESFDDDIAAATAGVDRLWSYLVDHAPVDPARVCVAGEGAGATVATAVALYADRVAARAVAIAPRRHAKLRDLPLPLPELRGDDPRPEASLSIVVDDPSGEGADAADAAWWRDELVEYARIGLAAEIVPRTESPLLERLQVVNAVRAGLGLAPEPPRGDMVARSFLRVARGSPRERLWARVAAERQGHLPVVDAPPADAGLAPLELEVHAADFAAEDALPVCPGPFGGTTLVVLPAGTPADEVAAWKALVSNDPLAKQSPFTRLRVAVLDGDPADALPAVLGKLESERRRNVLIAPAVFYADGETMRALRDLAAGFEGRMTLHWRPGLGGR